MCVKQDRSVVKYTRVTNSTTLLDHKLTPTGTEVVETLVVLIKSVSPVDSSKYRVQRT
jgi:hypothetical protein